MSDEMYEFDTVSRITVGAIGGPGRRTFYLQASQENRTISLKMEKEQAHALAKGIDAILEELEHREVRPISFVEEPPASDLDLEEPVEPAFVVGQIGLAFDPEAAAMVLAIEELPAEEDVRPAVAHFRVSLGQMRALSHRAMEVVSRGRPICPLCRRPIDPEGHFCPRGNGHSRRIQEN
jgi:uncharacterized repeat protein (TIGR03847 family)